jgi:hypothetical protein
MARFGEVRTMPQYEAWIDELRLLAERTEAQVRAAGAISPASRMTAYVRRTIAERRASPEETWRLVGLKLREWLRPYPNPIFWAPGIVGAVALFYTALAALAIAGLAKTPRRGVALFSVAVLALSMTAHLLFIVVWRYRAPYWDPVLILFGVFGAGRIASGLGRPRASLAGH